ncbi:FAD binding domain-containing protein [Xylariaceae sp. FL1272]|nr:FAD binding domain-containing protein [Xylariaceae sp. FL1272]
MRFETFVGILALAIRCKCANFAFETIVLTESDITSFPSIAFGNLSAASPTYNGPACKVYPGTADWPSESEWTKLNSSLGGALLHPIPPAAVCYDGSDKDMAQCNFLLRDASSTRFYSNDPLTVLTNWPEGDSCYATATTAGLTCTRGGYPEYVVNVSTVKHIQGAVNFARNKDLRVVIKNTGHDFLGRSVGFGSLSIWTHWLKYFDFLPAYSIGEYNGMAARVGAGLESWELFAYMTQYNMTVLVAGSYTVGAYGGWILGGGHSALASTYGMGTDQVLGFEVVTADGRFITADVERNTDLFFALRGGGGGNFGIVTSLIVKAHPPISVLSSSLAFSVPAGSNNVEGFWSAIDAYHDFGLDILDNRGTAYSYIQRSGNSTSPGFTFSTNIEMPGMTASELSTFVQPLYTGVAALGFNIRAPVVTQASNWLDTRHGVGDTPGVGSRFASRIFPRVSFEDPDRFVVTQQAIRDVVEAGYQFHGIHLAPTLDVAGYPGRDGAVNPAFRIAAMHADVFEGTSLRGLNASSVQAAHARFNIYMDRIRQATPEGGSYLNEADVEEPNWQQSFFGDNYRRLLTVKRSWDPWQLFYTAVGVGSEEWAVRLDRGLPTQDGPLCRAG